MKKFKILSLVLLCSVVASCSSDPYKRERKQRDVIMDHISQKPEALDGAFDEKYNTKVSRDGNELIAVGIANGNIQADENVLVDKAIFKAKAKLLEAAPTEFKKMVQQSVGSSTDDQDTNYEQSSLMITEVKALTGFHVEEGDRDCKRFSEPTVSGDYRFVKTCKVIVKIPLGNIEKAFKYTLKSKHGIEDKSLADQLANK